MYFSFALAGHRGTCLRPLHIFALLCFQACACYTATSTSTQSQSALTFSHTEKFAQPAHSVEIQIRIIHRNVYMMQQKIVFRQFVQPLNGHFLPLTDCYHGVVSTIHARKTQLGCQLIAFCSVLLTGIGGFAISTVQVCINLYLTKLYSNRQLRFLQNAMRNQKSTSAIPIGHRR